LKNKVDKFYECQVDGELFNALKNIQEEISQNRNIIFSF